MRYILLLVSCFVFSQEVVSKFVEKNKDIFFMGYVKKDKITYLLMHEKIKKNEKLYWKVLGENYVYSTNQIPFLVEGELYHNYFKKKDVYLLIEKTDNPIKRVDFLERKKRVYTYYSGELDIENIRKGVYNIEKRYDIDFGDYPVKRHRLFVTDDHFVLMGTENSNSFGYYKFTQIEKQPQKFRYAHQSNSTDKEQAFLTARVLSDESISGYFPTGSSLILEDESVVLVYPKVAVNGGFSSKNPLTITRLDLENKMMESKEIDIEKGTTLDYRVYGNLLYIACKVKHTVEIYSYDIVSEELTKINSIDASNSDFYSFYKSTYYFDETRNKTENTSFDKWERSMKKHLVLDVDELDNGLIEFKVSGVTYRDPNGFAKIFASIAIGGISGALSGVAIMPIFSGSDLQPLLTTTCFVLFPEDNSTQTIQMPKSMDINDKLMFNNNYFRDKILVGALSREILIFKQKQNDQYIIIDFSKENKLPN